MENSNNNHKTQQYAQKHDPSGTDIDPHNLGRIAGKSDEPGRVRESIFQIDCDMKRRYAELMSGLIENLSPVIIADKGINSVNGINGGEFDLIYDRIQEIEESELSNTGKRFQIY